MRGPSVPEPQTQAPPRRGLLGLLVGASIVVGGLSTSFALQRWERDNVEERYRSDRWETTSDGLFLRAKTEELCGPLDPDAWLDWPPGATRPIFREASPELQACYAERVEAQLELQLLRPPS